jgi:hypothetical protein
VTNPAAPHALRKYDNLGRVVASALYSSTSGLSSSSDPTSVATNRLALSETRFDEMGRVWKSVRHKIDLADGSDDDSLDALTWYDAEGQVVKVDRGSLEKYQYDRLGRRTHTFTLAKDNDSAYADADDVTGDIVLEEHQVVFDTPKDDAILEFAIQRFHTDYGTGETTGALDQDGGLKTLTSGQTKGRAQIEALWYDRFGRVTERVAYGTYGGSTFDFASVSKPSGSTDTALLTSFEYQTDGTLLKIRSPKHTSGTPDVTYFEYDAAGRRTKEVHNYVDGSPSGEGSSGDPVDDQTTLFTYENGLLKTLVADLPGTGNDQTTTYTYGTTAGSSAGESKIATGHLLQKVTYPDSTGSTDTVRFAYNAQGQHIYRADQAGNVLEVDLDDRGRAVATKVTTLASGFDGAVRRIARSYDSLSRVEKVTQYDAATSGNVVNEVKTTFDGWGQIQKFEQDRNSAVGATGSVDDYEVSYTYEKATTGRNAIRRLTQTLPSGKEISYLYRSTGGLHDDEASRVSHVKDGTLVLADYSYLAGLCKTKNVIDLYRYMIK